MAWPSLLIAPAGAIASNIALTQPNYPWSNGQVERMNRTLKEATVRRYHYEVINSFAITSWHYSMPTTSLSD
jgi:hypothetical protein